LTPLPEVIAGAPVPSGGLDPVVIVPYRRAWPLMFAAEAALIRAALGGSLRRLEHIGSTAVPDMPAKPVIDIDAAIARELGLDEIDRLDSIGYDFLGEYGVPGRAFFRKGRPYTHHLNVFVEGHLELTRHVIFRERLRAAAGMRSEYAALKLRLAAQLGHDRAAYTRAKAPCIETGIRLAGHQ